MAGELEIRRLGPGDIALLDRAAPGVYGDPIVRVRAGEFLGDPRHHAVVALQDGVVVGSVTAVHYVHPDKPAPELWVNELAVAPSHQGRGLAKSLMKALLERARELGCAEAWVLTDRTNLPAMRVYAGAGGTAAARDQVMFTFDLTSPAAETRERRPDGHAEDIHA